jgi:hypothetical protein
MEPIRALLCSQDSAASGGMCVFKAVHPYLWGFRYESLETLYTLTDAFREFLQSLQASYETSGSVARNSDH